MNPISPIPHSANQGCGKVGRSSKTSVARKVKTSPGDNQESMLYKLLKMTDSEQEEIQKKLDKPMKREDEQTPMVTKVKRVGRPRKDQLAASLTGRSKNTERQIQKIVKKRKSPKKKQLKTDTAAKIFAKKRGRPKGTRNKVKDIRLNNLAVSCDSPVPEVMQRSQDKTLSLIHI